MNIIHKPEQCRFELYTDAPEAAFVGQITYCQLDKHTLAAQSTQVQPCFEGQGHAGRLLDALAAYAEAQNAKIIPVCPYVVHAFRKHAEKYKNILPEDKPTL